MEVVVIKKTKSKEHLYLKKLNVAAYARVSTKLENQVSSIESQKRYYTEFIKRNKNWNFVKVYSDEGISGRRLKNRDEFIDMINDAMNGKIDLIYTKSVSRFARNTVDLLKVVRILKEKGVTIIFEEENINTSTIEGELLLTVLAAIAQYETETLSSHVTLGWEMNRRLGKITKTNRPFGYRYTKSNNLSIVKSEAKTVKMIFNMYSDGKTLYEIQKYLNENRIKTLKNTKWYAATLSHLLRKKIYIGTLERGHVSKNGNTYEIKNNHQPIIDEETWNRVQQRINNNYKRDAIKDQLKDLYCGFCGNKARAYGTRKYICCDQAINGHSSCKDCKNIQTKYFKECFIKILIRILETEYDYTAENRKTIKLKRLKEKHLEEKKKLIDELFEKRINEYYFNKKNEELDNQIKQVNQIINKIEFKKIGKKRFEQVRESIIKKIIETTYDINEFSYDLFEKIVSFTLIGEVSKVRTKDPYVIKFFYDDKQLFIEEEREKNYIDFSKNFILYSKLFYRKEIKSFKVNTYENRDYKIAKGLKVEFYVRKEEV